MTRTKNGVSDIRRDTLENWRKAKNYIPNTNTIIIVDIPDEKVLLKIGDGKTNVNDLPNILDYTKIQDKIPSSTFTVEGGVLVLN